MRTVLMRAGFAAGLCALAPAALAQSAVEKAYPDGDVPPVLQRMQTQGVQLRYLGTEAGTPGFLARNGQGDYQVYYVVGPDHVIAGYLFDRQGRNVTGYQLADKGITLETIRDGSGGSEPDSDREASAEAGDGALSGVSLWATTDVATTTYRDVREAATVFRTGPSNAPRVTLVANPSSDAGWAYWKTLTQRDDLNIAVVPVAQSKQGTRTVGRIIAHDDPASAWQTVGENGDTDGGAVTDSARQNAVRQMQNIVKRLGRLDVPGIPVVYARIDGSVKRFAGDPLDLSAALDELDS